MVHAATLSPAGSCQTLEWDSEFFGRRIARVAAKRLDADGWQAVKEFCRDQSVECLYFLCDSADQTSIRVAEQAGFDFVDIRLTLERRQDPVVDTCRSVGEVLRLACLEDVATLRAIAGVSHRDTRFHVDRHFPPERCDELYRTWIAKSCQGYADAVWVAGPEGRPTGYITCHIDAPDRGRIGLFAVATEAQGKGLGHQLVEAALSWLARQGVARVTVVTQGRNTPAQRVYQRAGFRTHQVELWYHRWFQPARSEVDR
jgi:dTDP-4-amino-4,6-dideoxy-D-galactose acyltransferase